MSTIKKNHSHQAYWEDRYKHTICEHYEWISKSEPIISLLNKHGILNEGNGIRSIEAILEVGCGTSHFMKHLLKEIKGKKGRGKSGEDHEGNEVSVTAIDFSK